VDRSTFARNESHPLRQPSLTRASAQRELRLGEPGEGCPAQAAKRRRRTSLANISINIDAFDRSSCQSDSLSPTFLLLLRWIALCTTSRMARPERRFVYILRSDVDPNRHYVGLTCDVRQRLRWHNAGQNTHTARAKPWSLIVSLEFASDQSAWRFERYLKSGSGRAFAKRHFS
jgi:predicted GIY-YIG superfamily endonuclease